MTFMATRRAVRSTVTVDQTRERLRLLANPNGRTNADVLKPWVNGMDLTRRPAGKWVVANAGGLPRRGDLLTGDEVAQLFAHFGKVGLGALTL